MGWLSIQLFPLGLNLNNRGFAVAKLVVIAQGAFPQTPCAYYVRTQSKISKWIIIHFQLSDLPFFFKI